MHSSNLAPSQGAPETGAVVGVRSISMPSFVGSAVPVLLNAPVSNQSAVAFDSSPILYATNYLPVYSSDSAGTYFAHHVNQSAVYQPAVSVATTVYGGQPFAPLGSHLFAQSGNHPLFPVGQPFTNPSGSRDHSLPYASYATQLAPDGSTLYAGFQSPYSSVDNTHFPRNGHGNAVVNVNGNGQVHGFGSQSVAYVTDQLAKTNLAEEAAFSNDQQNGSAARQGTAVEAVAGATGNGHFVPDVRRRRATANGDGTDYAYYRGNGNSRRYDSRPTPHSRHRNADSFALGSAAYGYSYASRYPGNRNGAAQVSRKRENAAPSAVFDDTDFPALNDALKPGPKNLQNTTRNDENGNENRSKENGNAVGENASAEKEKVEEKPAEKEKSESEAVDIERTVNDLVARLKPAVENLCAKPFADCVPGTNARFFIVKSNSEDDVYRSLKYSIWCSTAHGNGRLQKAFEDTRQGDAGPVLLFFSVNGSGHFCGVARMSSAVDPAANARIWVSDRFTGRFDVQWLYVKDVPNTALRHIKVDVSAASDDAAYKAAFTHQRDCTEVPRREALVALKIIHEFPSTTTIFDDARYYEQRERDHRLAVPSCLADAPHAHAAVTSRHNSAPTPVTVDASDKVSYANVVNGLSQNRSNANVAQVDRKEHSSIHSNGSLRLSARSDDADPSSHCLPARLTDCQQ